MQLDGTISWETENKIMEFTSTAIKITAFRTNDYRVGVNIEDDTNTTISLFTTRNWAAMAIAPGIIGVKSAVSASLVAVNKIHANTEGEGYLTVASRLNLEFLYGGITNTFIQAHNIDEVSGNYGLDILISLEHGLYEPSLADFIINYNDFDDNYDTNNCISITRVTDFKWILRFNDFNSAVGDILITYTSAAGTNEAGNKFNVFSASFTPTGLVSPDVPAPSVEVIWNE